MARVVVADVLAVAVVVVVLVLVVVELATVPVVEAPVAVLEDFLVVLELVRHRLRHCSEFRIQIHVACHQTSCTTCNSKESHADNEPGNPVYRRMAMVQECST